MLIRRSPDRYTAVGHFVADKRAQTVWEVELTRISSDAGFGFGSWGIYFTAREAF